jgi:hypothetical protein
LWAFPTLRDRGVHVNLAGAPLAEARWVLKRINELGVEVLVTRLVRTGEPKALARDVVR